MQAKAVRRGHRRPACASFAPQGEHELQAPSSRRHGIKQGQHRVDHALLTLSAVRLDSGYSISAVSYSHEFLSQTTTCRDSDAASARGPCPDIHLANVQQSYDLQNRCIGIQGTKSKFCAAVLKSRKAALAWPLPSSSLPSREVASGILRPLLPRIWMVGYGV